MICRSFILLHKLASRFQRQNDGNFPSLSLTHKEVGGSFYTVREIVREIIQENRVLGPAKLTLEEQKTNELVEQSPLGSISTGPHDSLLLSSNENLFVVDNDMGLREELISVSDGLSSGPGHQGLGSRQIINGCHDGVGNREDGNTSAEVEVSQPFEAEKGMVATKTEVAHIAEFVAASTPEVTHMTDNIAAATKDVAEVMHVTEDAATTKAKAIHVTKDVATSMDTVTSITADVIVETFPLRPLNKTTNYLDGESGELSETLEENKTKESELGSGNGKINAIDLVETSEESGLVGEKRSDKTAASLSGVNFASMEKEAVECAADSPLGNSNCSLTTEVLRHGTLVKTDLEIEVSAKDIISPKTVEQSQPSDETKVNSHLFYLLE